MVGSGVKRGTAELAILSVLQTGELHGYEIARRIEQQTGGKLKFTLASLYPLLYRMEREAGCAVNGNQRERTAAPPLSHHLEWQEEGCAVAGGMV